MLRDDADIALNDLLIACRKLAGHYDRAADEAGASQRKAMFRRMGRRRRDEAHRLEALVRRYGYLPEEPDKDREDIARLVTTARTAVADDGACVWSAKAAELERVLDDRTAEALKMAWPPEALALLRALSGTGRRHRETLAGVCG